MRTLALVVFFLWAGPALAADPLVLKVYSYPCDRPSAKRVGSGTAVAHLGKIYVLTSSHVVFHGTRMEGMCHRVEAASVGALEAEFYRAHFGFGMALLQVMSPPPKLAAMTLAWAKREANPGTTATLTGFAWQSASLARDANARILSTESDRALLPSVEKMIEVRGHNEFGMSGGPLLASDGKYLGMLSHQYLSPRTGGTPFVKSYGASDRASEERIALVVPRAVVASWVELAFKDAQESALSELVESQLKDTQGIKAGGIKLQERKAPAPKAPSPATRGGDGVGVGGDQDGRDVEAIEITLAPGETSVEWPFGEAKWLGKAKDELLLQRKLEITGLRRGNEEARPVSDLASTLALLRKGYRPLWKRQSKLENLSQREGDIVRGAVKVRAALKKLRARFLDPKSEARALLGEIDAQLELASLGRFDEIETETLRDLLRPAADTWRKRAWSELFSLDLEETVELKRELLAWGDLLERI